MPADARTDGQNRAEDGLNIRIIRGARLGYLIVLNSLNTAGFLALDHWAEAGEVIFGKCKFVQAMVGILACVLRSS